MAKTVRELVELGEETVSEPTKRFLVVKPDEFNVLAKFTGYTTNKGITQALVEFARQVNTKKLVVSKPEAETPPE